MCNIRNGIPALDGAGVTLGGGDGADDDGGDGIHGRIVGGHDGGHDGGGFHDPGGAAVGGPAGRGGHAIGGPSGPHGALPFTGFDSMNQPPSRIGHVDQ
ncbi:hypothetical protein [Actinomadura sp. DC4]|uniref:hypothetical protein n=1 Tax=Actinomadura sp. DC4 TaxID=3055069 RepID=UPI0025B233DA|nr:hypothetical protein [Actinomadura sp. DC4]MDN3351962.1 hypothetical protein [Actinomadura sp. DC4]